MILVRGVLVFILVQILFQYDWFNYDFLVDQSDHHLWGYCGGGYLFTRDSEQVWSDWAGY